jgi:ATP-dependent DNA helicase RecG
MAGGARRVPDAAAQPTESIRSLLDAARRPIAYVARAGQTAAARTRLAAPELARRARLLASAVGHAGLDCLLTELSVELESYEGAAPHERVAIAGRCQAVIGRIEAKLEAPPVYRANQLDPEAARARLGRSVRYLKGVGPQLGRALEKSGFRTIEDLLYHLPFRYEDRRTLRTIASLRTDESASVVGELVQLERRVVGRSRRSILEGVLRDDTGLLGLTWYNPVRYRTGQPYRVFGRVEGSPRGGKRMVHPEMESALEEEQGGIQPVYEKPVTMKLWQMRRIIRQALHEALDFVPSALPPEIAAAARVTDLVSALRAVHLPEAGADLSELNDRTSLDHRSIVFDELFYLQLGMLLRRRSVSLEPGLVMPRRGRLTERLDRLLPFELTKAQRRVLEEICRDMSEPRPMHRLVQGDVGSGKTIVALFAALVAVENGHQAAFMAPTELLAEQHFRTVGRFVEALGVRAHLLTAKRGRAERARLHDEIAGGEIDLVVGTHALIQENVRMPRLGLGIIDEQHRFGVLQRAALRALRRPAEDVAPDILLMSATPIPRTLTMTLYGDLDVSVLDQMPAGRQPVQTMIFAESERQRVYDLVKREIDRGRQGYVVYPLVEASDREGLRDATTMAEELGRAVFVGYRVGLVHGRMKPDEKEAVMRRFRSGDLQVLVASTVIEVGVDVPNATIMVIEHAERFGLSQLHQLRGRVGRGGDRAVCALIASTARDTGARQRLDTLRRTSDGFKVAEKDLELRGPGDFLGTRQSGLPDFRVADLMRDGRTLLAARRAAEQWLRRDPDLALPESNALRRVLLHRWEGRLGLAEIG